LIYIDVMLSYHYKNIIKALHYIFRQEYKLGRLHQRR
jgi:hypothetical protein